MREPRPGPGIGRELTVPQQLACALRILAYEGWRENLEEWNKVGSDYPFHYLGSPETMCRIGRAFGEAMLKLRAGK